MPNFAVLSGNIVTNLIVANSLSDAELILGAGSCVEYPENIGVKIGFDYNPETNIFSEPIQEVVEEVVQSTEETTITSTEQSVENTEKPSA